MTNLITHGSIITADRGILDPNLAVGDVVFLIDETNHVRSRSTSRFVTQSDAPRKNMSGGLARLDGDIGGTIHVQGETTRSAFGRMTVTDLDDPDKIIGTFIDETPDEYWRAATGVRGPGQPPIGPQVKFACPPDMLVEIDARAKTEKTTRSDVIRQLLQTAIDSERE